MIQSFRTNTITLYHKRRPPAPSYLPCDSAGGFLFFCGNQVPNGMPADEDRLITNRRVTVSLVKRSATSGRVFLRALVSILEEVTAPMYSVLPSLDALRIAHSGLYGGLNCLRFCLCVLN